MIETPTIIPGWLGNMLRADTDPSMDWARAALLDGRIVEMPSADEFVCMVVQGISRKVLRDA